MLPGQLGAGSKQPQSSTSKGRRALGSEQGWGLLDQHPRHSALEGVGLSRLSCVSSPGLQPTAWSLGGGSRSGCFICLYAKKRALLAHSGTVQCNRSSEKLPRAARRTLLDKQECFENSCMNLGTLRNGISGEEINMGFISQYSETP